MKKRLRVVVDTNIFISALLGSKNSRFIIEEFLKGNIDIVITNEIFLEIVETLKNKKFCKIKKIPILNPLKFYKILSKLL